MSRERPSTTSKTDRTSERLQTIPHHGKLVLSERDRAVFFESLVHPPAVNSKLRRAFAAARLRVES